MHTVTVYSPDGELFEVPKSRSFGLLAKGWKLTKPEEKKAEVRQTVRVMPKSVAKPDDAVEKPDTGENS